MGPPCYPIEPLLDCQPLADAAGYVDVDPKTLQSKAFPNIFGVGDCANSPNAKTAAAVSSHLKTVEKNLAAVMEGGKPTTEVSWIVMDLGNRVPRRLYQKGLHSLQDPLQNPVVTEKAL